MVSQEWMLGLVTLAFVGPLCVAWLAWELICLARDVPAGMDRVGAVMGARPAEVAYTNWRGETRLRRLVFLRVYYGSTRWHPEPQWLLEAFDKEDGRVKDFALLGFRGPAA